MYNKRQEAILDFIKQNNNSLSRQDIQDHIATIFPVKSKVTLTRDLKLLLDDAMIVKTGKAKATLYGYAPSSSLVAENVNVETYFALDADKRKLKTEKFNFDIWPYLKNILSEKEKRNCDALNQKYLSNKAKLSPTILHKELERLTIELSWKSSKIEGNTYTLLDTERLLKDNIPAFDKTIEETNMIINHKKALEFIFEKPSYYKELSVAKIEDIHALLVNKLGVSVGVRTNMVGIIGTNYKPLDNSFQIKEALHKLVELINTTENYPEKALLAVLMISYIQPFEDGNKRTARILGNALLLAGDYCPLSYRSIDEVEYKKGIVLFYEQNNAAYFKKLFLEQFKSAVDKYF